MSTPNTAEEVYTKKNQLYRELLLLTGLDPFCGHGTSPRKQMFATQVGQTLVPKHSTIRSYQTGMERAYGKFTFNIKAPADIQIISIVPRYPKIEGEDTIAFNPQSIVIFEELETRTIGALDIRTFKTNHPYFGFDYVAQPGAQKLKPNEVILKDTVFYDSPSITPNGDYKYGVEVNVFQGTLPGASEDGTIISESCAKLFTYNTYEDRDIEFGSNLIPLNCYGNESKYQICPEIGQKVREDGLLMALREVDDNLAPYYQSNHALRRYFPMFDKAVYVPPGGTVIDIQVHHDPLCKQARVPTGMDEQMLKYQRSLMNFHKTIKSIWSDLIGKRGPDNVRLSPEFERLVVDAIAYTDDKVNARPQRQYRLAKHDDWRIKIVVRYENIPSVGNKLSGTYGDKGIIVKVLPDSHMPVDENGNRADFISDSLATIARSTLGRTIEPFLNAAGRDIVHKMALNLGLKWGTLVTPQLLELKNKDGKVRQEFERLKTFYYAVNPSQMGPWHENLTDKELYEHLAFVITRTLPVMYYPPSNEKEMINIIQDVQKDFMPLKSHVTYVNNQGETVKTKEKFEIGRAYVIILDKTGVDAAAIASCKLGHFGVPSRITRQDKHSYPNRRQPTRSFGEAEMRIVASYCEPWVTAEVVDRNTNKDTMAHIVKNLLYANSPANVANLVDRTEIPYGSSRPMQLIRHMAECAGWGFEYKPYTPRWNLKDIEEFKHNDSQHVVSQEAA